MSTLDTDFFMDARQSLAQILDRRISFVKPRFPDRHMDDLRKKYIPVNDDFLQKQTSQQKNTMKVSITSIDPSKFNLATNQNNQKYKKGLFDDKQLVMNWKRVVPVGPGLRNYGNTCFMNSVLQCLTYTPPLANFLLSKSHSRQCTMIGGCLLCDMERHVVRCFDPQERHGSSAISPKQFVQKLKLVAKHFRPGRQEDSHEYCRYLIEAFQRSCLHGYSKYHRRIV